MGDRKPPDIVHTPSYIVTQQTCHYPPFDIDTPPLQIISTQDCPHLTYTHTTYITPPPTPRISFSKIHRYINIAPPAFVEQALPPPLNTIEQQYCRDKPHPTHDTHHTTRCRRQPRRLTPPSPAHTPTTDTHVKKILASPPTIVELRSVSPPEHLV